MRGYSSPKKRGDSPRGGDELGEVARWEAMAIHAVGTVIDFWGFKRNQGKVWALLYLRDQAMSAAEIRRALGLSKGAASMILRELETWGVIKRTRRADSQARHFIAETELMKMLGRVFRDREVHLVRRVKEDLAQAEALARDSGDAPETVLVRLARMRQLASLIEHALGIFLKTARLDVTDARGIFDEDDDETL